MKKSIKVLSLVLAIALICGAFVIGAFATKVANDITAADGVMVTTSANLETASATLVKGALDYTKPEEVKNETTTVQKASGKHTKLTMDIVNRTGTAKIVTSPFESNKYLVYTKGDKGTSSGPFVSSGYTQHDVNKDKNNVNTYNYQIIDFDVMFPEGNATTSFSPTLQVRGYKADGTTAAPGLNTCTINEVNGKIMLYNGLGAEVMTLPGGGWTHITGVYEFVSVSEAYIYLFVNDQLVNKGAFTASNLQNATQFWFSEMRWNFNENASSIALDNFSWRSIDSTKYAKMSELNTVLKAGVGASLSTWTDTLYEADKMPFGTLVATIGEGETAQYFDNLAKAIAAAEPGATVTLNANCSDTITVNKAITVKKNGFTANFTPDKVAMSETDDAYNFVSTSVRMTVTVRPCGHGCITAKSIQLYPGANIWDAIVEAYGAEPNCSFMEGETKHVFDGFKVFNSTAPIIAKDETFNKDKDLVVTDECANKSIVLDVAHKVVNPAAKVYEADGTLVKTYYEDDTILTLLNAAEAKAGRKIVLLANFVVDETAKYVEKGSTLDLNGYTLKFLRAPDATGKSGSSLLRIKANSTFTLTSSVVGGKIFEGAAYKKNNGASVPFAACEGAKATLNVIGKNAAGETTLSYYGGVIAQAYGSRGSVNVDGGYYCRNRSDNFALFDMRVLSDCTFKNATFDAKLGATLALSGRDAGMGETTATVTVDNCDFIRGGVVNYISDKVTVNFTNCVLGGDINPVVEGTATAITGDEINIGKGCKLAAGITLHSLVNVVGAVDAIETLTYDVTNNNWGAEAVEDKLTLVDETVTVQIAKMVADKITVTLTKDGKEYTVDAIAGMKAVTPATEVEGTKGMVNCSYTVAIPADAKDGDVIAIPDDAEKMYTAGKVPVLFNITITGHTSYNFYLPIVEGITYDAAAALTHNLSGYNPARPATNAANSIKTDAAGNKYMMLQTWPGMFRQDDAGSIVIKYSYDGTALTYTIDSFGGFDYYNTILNSETESDELKTLIANMAKASEQFIIAKNDPKSPVSEGLKKLMETEAFKKYAKDFEIPADASNKALYEKMAADGYVQEIALATNGGITGLTMGVKVNGEYGFKMDSMTAREYNIPVVNQWREDSTGYIFMHNFRAYGLNNEFKIDVYEKVTYKSGAVDKFEGDILATYEGWTLAGYINDNAETLTADQLAYAKAMYSYACAAEAYLNWRQANGLTIWS